MPIDDYERVQTKAGGTAETSLQLGVTEIPQATSVDIRESAQLRPSDGASSWSARTGDSDILTAPAHHFNM